MTKLGAQVLAGKIVAPDVLVGGTPCQAFSVAGMREGPTNPRGALTIKYVELADAVDYVRAGQRKPACVVVWENVPGVLSDKGNAFGCFLGALAGEDRELQPSGKKWPDAGCVYGPKRTIAWWVLDVQYFGLAQRRRRVFVVASARDGFDPTEVLFERDGVRRDYAPRLGEEENIASTIAGGARKRGGYSTDDIHLTAPILRAQSQSSHRADSEAFIPVSAYVGGRTSGAIDVAACLTAKGMRIDFEVESFVVHGSQDPNVRIDQARTLGRNNGMENAVLAFSCKDYGGDAGEIASTLHAMNHSGSMQTVAVRLQSSHQFPPPLRSGNMRNNSNPVTEAEMLVSGSKVRRLTPRECERLQGMSDDYTLIPWDGWRKLDTDETPEQCIADGMDVRKAKQSKAWYVRDADGPRYKAIWNSKAVTVVRWIGRRILKQINLDE